MHITKLKMKAHKFINYFNLKSAKKNTFKGKEWQSATLHLILIEYVICDRTISFNVCIIHTCSRLTDISRYNFLLCLLHLNFLVLCLQKFFMWQYFDKQMYKNFCKHIGKVQKLHWKNMESVNCPKHGVCFFIHKIKECQKYWYEKETIIQCRVQY
jgi:hypothetical protein